MFLTFFCKIYTYVPLLLPNVTTCTVVEEETLNFHLKCKCLISLSSFSLTFLSL